MFGEQCIALLDFLSEQCVCKKTEHVHIIMQIEEGEKTENYIR